MARFFAAASVALAIIIVALSSGCLVDLRAARGDFLVDSLVTDNEDLLLRDAGEVALKWQRMTESPFLFLRGNLGIWARDVMDAGAQPFDCGEACDVLLVGDPHVENFGSFRGVGGVQHYDINDFDASGYGPYHFDVRRLALSFTVAMRVLVNDDLALEAGVAVAEGYAAAAAESEPRFVTAFNGPPVVRELCEKAREEFQDGEWDAPFVGDEIVRTEPPDERVPGDEYLIDVDNNLVPALAAALIAWREETGTDAEVVDVARKLGSGVGSYTLLRFVALLDDGTEIELKEARDPLRVVGLSLFPRRPFDDNAERVVTAQRALQSAPDLDARLAAVAFAPLGLKVRDDTPWQKTMRVTRLEKLLGDGKPYSEVLELARLDGALLFHAHARGPAADGSPLKVRVTQAVSEQGDAIVDDVRAYLEMAAPALEDDALLLGERLEADALLGWRP